MTILYYREARLPANHTVRLEDDFKPIAINTYNETIRNHSTYGLFKSKINLIYLGVDDGLYYAKIQIKVGHNIFKNNENEFTCFHKEDLYSHIKSYIDSSVPKNSILLFITDNGKEEEFDYLIRSLKQELNLKRKAEILL